MFRQRQLRRKIAQAEQVVFDLFAADPYDPRVAEAEAEVARLSTLLCRTESTAKEYPPGVAEHTVRVNPPRL